MTHQKDNGYTTRRRFLKYLGFSALALAVGAGTAGYLIFRKNEVLTQIEVLAQIPEYGKVSISRPHTYENITLFIISKTPESQEVPEDFITLEEGLAANQVMVSEKEEAEVGTLQVENLSDKPLFLQAGDLLQGGKQDRIIRTSLIIPPRSGKVDVPSLCVEQSRWSGTASFGEAGRFVASQQIRLAINANDQREVWHGVAIFNAAVGGLTNEELKTSSINEAIDSKKMQALSQEYEEVFSKLQIQYPQAIGVAYALNGRIYAVELFGANGLFRKTYPKLLKAYANEAVITPPDGEVEEVTAQEVEKFITEMQEGQVKEERIVNNEVIQLENSIGITAQLKDSKGRVIHWQYLKRY